MVLLVLIHTTHPFCSSSDIAHSSMHFICHIVGVLVASYFFLLYHFYLCEMTTWQKQVFNGYLLQIEIWCEQCSLCCTAQCTLTHITKQSENFGLIHCWKIIFCHVNYMFMWGNGGTPTQTKPYLRWKKIGIWLIYIVFLFTILCLSFVVPLLAIYYHGRRGEAKRALRKVCL